jgi:hypothetical protein
MERMQRAVLYARVASPDQQISSTDPDSRSMATSGRGSGVVGYNVQVAVDTESHLIVTHEVTNVGSDRAQLANVAKDAVKLLKMAADLANRHAACQFASNSDPPFASKNDPLSAC